MRKQAYLATALQVIFSWVLPAQSTVLFQTTTPPSAGIMTSGLISPTHFVGNYFVLNAPAHIDSIGLAASVTTPGNTIFGAILNVPDLSTLPTGFSSPLPLATALIHPTSTNSIVTAQVKTPISMVPGGVDLPAGTYVVVFGTGFFAASADPANLASSDGAAAAPAGATQVEYGPFCGNATAACWAAASGAPSPFYFVVIGGPIVAPPYSLTSLNPSTVSIGGAAFTLTVNGTGFNANSTVQWNGSALPTTFVSATQLIANVPASLISSITPVNVTVATLGVPTNSLLLTLATPGITIQSTNPTSALLAGHQFTLTINGSGFQSDSKVLWNGSALQTIFIHPGELAAVVPASLLASAGSVDLYVTSSAGSSPHFLQFTIVQAPTPPVISSLNPNSAFLGSAFTLTVNGAGFLTGATLNWNGTQVPTTFVSATALTANIPPSLTAFQGTVNVTVQNPGGASSNAASFLVEFPVSRSTLAALAHYAVGSNFLTGITVVNTGPVSASYVISFLDDNGVSASLPFTNGTTDRLAGTLPPFGSLYVEAGNPNLALTSGWAQINADNSIVVQGLFRSTLNNTHYEAAVESSTGGNAFELSFDATLFAVGTPIYTGIAIANLDNQIQATISCKARDSSGMLIPNGIVIPVIPASGHWAGFQFPVLAGQRGTLDCVSTTTVAVIGLRFIGTDTFSSLRVIKK